MTTNSSSERNGSDETSGSALTARRAGAEAGGDANEAPVEPGGQFVTKPSGHKSVFRTASVDAERCAASGAEMTRLDEALPGLDAESANARSHQHDESTQPHSAP